MGFFKNGSIIFFLFLDLRSTQTNTENGQSSFLWTFFVSKPQSKIGVDDGRIKHKEAKGIISYTDGSVLDHKTGCGIHSVHGQRVIYNGNFYT